MSPAGTSLRSEGRYHTRQGHCGRRRGRLAVCHGGGDDYEEEEQGDDYKKEQNEVYTAIPRR